MLRRIFFIGGTYVEFTRYCRENKINPHRQVFVQDVYHIQGCCLCEECVEIVWGATGIVSSEVSETIARYIAMGKMHG